MRLKTLVAAIQVHDDLAKAVLLTARSIASYDAVIHVVSAWPTVNPVAGFGSEIGALAGPLTQEAVAANREAREADERALKAFAAGLVPNARVHMLDGEPGGAVTDYAKKAGADLIIAGSHQKGFWGSLLSGAASRDLVRDAPCGVLLVTKPFADKVLREVI
ncbi:MAG: universal stress protein [Parvularculaceae bacterium]|nr:universal stress protein [Parvularculaceae bacterium]